MSNRYKTFVVIGAALWLDCVAVVQAADGAATQQPLETASEAIDKNIEKKPGNKGLENARERTETNRTRIEEKRSNQSEKPAAPGKR